MKNYRQQQDERRSHSQDSLRTRIDYYWLWMLFYFVLTRIMQIYWKQQVFCFTPVGAQDNGEGEEAKLRLQWIQ